MVYGVLRFINFAHSDVFMIGAFAGFYLAPYVPGGTLGGGLVVLAASMVICAALGITIERLAYRPLRRSSKLNVLITAIGVSLLLENAGQYFFRAAPKASPVLFPVKSFTLGNGLVFSSSQLAVIVITILLLVGLELIVHRTKMGTAMRALSFNLDRRLRWSASTMTWSSHSLFGLGSALAAAGGILYSQNYLNRLILLMGILPGLKAFVAAVSGRHRQYPRRSVGRIDPWHHRDVCEWQPFFHLHGRDRVHRC